MDRMLRMLPGPCDSMFAPLHTGRCAAIPYRFLFALHMAQFVSCHSMAYGSSSLGLSLFRVDSCEAMLSRLTCVGYWLVRQRAS